ncbi:MAG: FAD-binding oxidoreductase [Pseudomonadota bacterium]
MELTGWGRWPRRDCRIAHLTPTALGRKAPSGELGNGATGQGDKGQGAIVHGRGRGYGDCAINPPLTVLSERCNRFLSFDEETGTLFVEAGVTSAEILELFVPRGWFLPVTPGTKFVTVGGMIAADVHGKNHHVAGSFGDHVHFLDLVSADGTVLRCSSQENEELFRMTIGGMGLTGHILRAAFRLIPIESAWIRQETVVAPDLDAAIDVFESRMDATYSVAWIDCLSSGKALGRSLIYLGEHARPEDLTRDRRSSPFHVAKRKVKSIPIDAPSWALNGLTVRAFNALYYRAGVRAPQSQLLDWDSYFYPLDAVLGWNRIYGRSGFAQYQFVLPLETSREGMREVLEAISAANLGSFLAVLKRFGAGAADRPLSFPMEGYTLALDFSLSSASLTLMDRLDEIVEAHGGRLYLAKDSRMSQRSFETGYGGQAEEYRRFRNRTGADRAFGSLMSRRLAL